MIWKIWGFSDIDGERKYTRRVHFTGPEGEDIKARLVYDYRTCPSIYMDRN